MNFTTSVTLYHLCGMIARYLVLQLHHLIFQR